MGRRMLGRFVLAVALLIVAIGVGFLAGVAALELSGLVLPPFRPEDDDTMRDRGPVAIAYATWAITSVIVLIAGARWARRIG